MFHEFDPVTYRCIHCGLTKSEIELGRIPVKAAEEVIIYGPQRYRGKTLTVRLTDEDIKMVVDAPDGEMFSLDKEVGPDLLVDRGNSETT